MIRQSAEATIVLLKVFFQLQKNQIVELAAKYRQKPGVDWRRVCFYACKRCWEGCITNTRYSPR